MAAAIGVIASVVGLALTPMFATSASIGIKAFASLPPEGTTGHRVRIWLGEEARADHGTTLGGHQPHVTLYTNEGTTIGRTWGGRVWQAGSNMDVDVHAEDAWGKPNHEGNRRAHYLLLEYAGNDAICIPAIQVRQPDQTVINISGDLVVSCNKTAWYPSNLDLFDDHVRPRCFWIDGDNSYGGKHQAFSVHLDDFLPLKGRQEQYNRIPTTLCDVSPRMHLWNRMTNFQEMQIFWPRLEYNADGSDKTLSEIYFPTWIESGSTNKGPVPQLHVGEADFSKRALLENGTTTENQPAAASRLRWPADRVIRTSHPEHSPEQCCKDELCHGPSMTNPASGVHCDMSTRTVYPLCGPGVDQECYDDDTHEIVEWEEDADGSHLEAAAVNSTSFIAASSVNGTASLVNASAATAAAPQETTLTTVTVPALSVATGAVEDATNNTTTAPGSDSGVVEKRATRPGYQAKVVRKYTDVVQWT